MDSDRNVRYLRCEGAFLGEWASDAAWVVVRIQDDGGQAWFAGYVLVDASGSVLEKSNTYGLFADEANWLEGQAGGDCIPASRADFAGAWRLPYARRSLWRRFLARLNGASDADGDPSELDVATSNS